ncbi:hypothetical protein HOS16_gp61 [Shigella phage vB_SflS-ISF001]|uniref:DUF7274 domain-containing protein n=1 Tax=Shigella phage vB_SflS-ISF001 TaxID=2048005 RepID=A0A2D1GQ16_9CAUD|nr:hypothetical protein HOS16_gp61 [Shigella phage vB_SflS-ISF001]ATN94139.1 hypothetical protein FLXISF001_061 [Shigella phage vB_SflS-ISF001]
MPRYNFQTKLTHVNGYMIPAKSTHYAMPAKHGIYLKFRGQWFLAAIGNFYIRITGENSQAIVVNSIPNNKIEVLK